MRASVSEPAACIIRVDGGNAFSWKVGTYLTTRSQISKLTAERISNITFNPFFLTRQPVTTSVNSWFTLMFIHVPKTFVSAEYNVQRIRWVVEQWGAAWSAPVLRISATKFRDCSFACHSVTKVWELNKHVILVTEESKPTRWHLLLYYPYVRLNMFRAPLCPSSGAHNDSFGYHIGHLVLELLLFGS